MALSTLAGVAAAQHVERLSVAPDGTQGNAASAFEPAISGDGRYVVFASSAGNLVASDSNGHDDVFVFDRMAGQAERVSVSTSGAQGNDRSGTNTAYPGRAFVDISDDGNFVVFNSFARNLVEGNCLIQPTPPPDCDSNGLPDVFFRDRGAGTTVRLNVSEKNDQTLGRFPGVHPTFLGVALSGDGGSVAFVAFELVDGDEGIGAYIRDLAANDTVWASPFPEPPTIYNTLSLSDDGMRLQMTNLADSPTLGDANGQQDVFVFHRGSGGGAGTLERVSIGHDGSVTDGESVGSAISGDGRFVAFWSAATNIVPGGPGPAGSALYVRDLLTQTTHRIGGPGCPPATPSCVAGAGSSASLSDDGRFVVFDYFGNDIFFPQDTTSAADVYLFDRDLDRTLRLSLDQNGSDPAAGVVTPALSDDGSVVAFWSAAADLVPADTGGFGDVFVGAPQLLTPIQAVRNTAPRSDGQPGAALVAHKKLVIRSYPRVPRGKGAPLAAVGHLCIDGPVVGCPSGQFFETTGQALEFGAVLPDVDRRNALDSLNFNLGGDVSGLLDPGVHTFEVRITPQTPGAFPTIVQSFEGLFNETESIDVHVYPIQLSTSGGAPVLPQAVLLGEGSTLTRETYPVSGHQVKNLIRTKEVFSKLPAATSAAAKSARYDLVLQIAGKLAIDRAVGTGTLAYGAAVVPELVDLDNPLEAGTGLLGLTFPSVPGVVITRDRGAGGVIVSSTIAHEIGHVLGLGDTYCWDADANDDLETPCVVDGVDYLAANPPPRSAIEGNESGTFVRESMNAYDSASLFFGRKAVFGPPGAPIYGFMGGARDNNSWATGDEYSWLYKTITRTPAGPAVSARLAPPQRTVVHIRGLATLAGTAEILPLLIFDSDDEFPPPRSGDDYTLEILDAFGQVLATIDFDLRFAVEQLGEDRSEVVATEETPFAITVDLPAGAAGLRLLQGDTELAEVEQSPQPPMVLWSSVTEQPGNVLDLAWVGSDLDGDDLTYSLFYSPNGVVLESLAIDLEATTASFDLDDATPISFGAFLRVRASDGWNTAEDDFPIGPAFALLDVDANGAVQALTDGLLVLRHLFGLSGPTLVNGALGAGCSRCAAADITTYLSSIAAQLDVDGNGSAQALTDGLLVLRYLFGLSGAVLTNGAVGAGCTRCDAAAIVPWLQGID